MFNVFNLVGLLVLLDGVVVFDDKFFVQDMFFYFLGEGFYVGYFFGYIVIDVYVCYFWMVGCNVLYVLGFDVFGLFVE